MVTVKHEVDSKPVTVAIFIQACAFDTDLVSGGGNIVIRQIAARLPVRVRAGQRGGTGLKSEDARFAKGECRAAVAVLLSMFVASCTSVGDSMVTAGMPAYNATDLSQAGSPQLASTDSAIVPTATGEPQQLMSAEGDTALPEQVAYVPTAKPTAALAATDLAIAAPADAATIVSTTPQALTPPSQPQEETAETARKVADGTADALHSRQADVSGTPTEKPALNDDPAAFAAPARPIAPKKKSFLAALFGSSSAQAAPTPAAAPKPVVDEGKPAKPIITLASDETGAKPLSLASTTGGGEGWSGDALPGVRKTALFEITRKSGIDDDSDVDLNEDEGFGSYQVASAAGMARLAPNGLLKQTESVDVACLKPSLVRVLKVIESHYGKKLIVTSGYRDPSRNRRARGAKNSLHMYCAAADIQVPGVSKWDLANFARSMAGRGGVGTYCHTDSVHVDVGPERDWNWRCRRRK
jgi:uncharacterized protein YcbK (DUF882 family)